MKEEIYPLFVTGFWTSNLRNTERKITASTAVAVFFTVPKKAEHPKPLHFQVIVPELMTGAVSIISCALSLWPSLTAVEVHAAGPVSSPTATQDEDKFDAVNTDTVKVENSDIF